jgi:hypothetical protein
MENLERGHFHAVMMTWEGGRGNADKLGSKFTIDYRQRGKERERGSETSTK